jgi:hypothetical protein
MILRRRFSVLSLAAAVPYLLLSTSQQAGVITHVFPDGSGERLVYARGTADRASELGKYLDRTLPGADWARTVQEGSAERVLAVRSAQPANLATTPEVEVKHLGIVNSPFSPFSVHTWSEKLTFDQGGATPVEVQGQGVAELKYIVRMPGTITQSTPPGKVEGNRVEWDVKVGPEPRTFTVESRSVRWAYVALWLYVLAFLVVKSLVWVPRVARKLPRKPTRI